MATEPTAKNQTKPWQFQPGQSGNPAGRPLGSKNQLGTAFVDALKKDFDEHGEAVIAKVREEKPDQYLKVISSILPKELHVKDMSLGDMTDEDLLGLLASIRSITAKDSGAETKRGTRKAPAKEDTGPQGRPN